MNPRLSLLLLTFFVLVGVTSPRAAAASSVPQLGDARLLLADPLTSADLVSGAHAKKSQHGEFTPHGWRALHRDGQLVIELADAVTLEGTLEVDLSNVDWPRANTASGVDTKLHFINMFSNANGDHHGEDGGTERDALWTLRAGASKENTPRYGEMFKVLWASRGAKRMPGSDYNEVVVPPPADWTWDPASRYTFRVTWSRARGTWDVAINGRRVTEQPWKNQVLPLRYIFLGKGGDYQSLQGTLFSNLRVYATASTSASVLAMTALDVPTIEVEGFVPYYRNPQRDALAIAADRHKDVFAAARFSFTGAPGSYDIALISLTERDGESTYRVKLNGRLLGQVENPASIDDVEVSHTWPAVSLRAGDVLQVESNSVSNRRVPEGSGFGYSRGRWRRVIFTPRND